MFIHLNLYKTSLKTFLPLAVNSSLLTTPQTHKPMCTPSFKLKIQLVVLVLFSLVVACGPPVNKPELEKASNFKLPSSSVGCSDSLIELTTAQQAALDALDELQVSGDGSNRLYGTYNNQYHPFYPPDTNFFISKEEFLMALSSFLQEHYSLLSAEDQSRLVAASAQAQEEYKVLLCEAEADYTVHESGLPMKGVWVLPNVLGRRDVVLVWR